MDTPAVEQAARWEHRVAGRAAEAVATLLLQRQVWKRTGRPARPLRNRQGIRHLLRPHDENEMKMKIKKMKMDLQRDNGRC